MGQATHTHNWEIVSSDQTGSIIECTGCPEMAFLEPEDAKQFQQAKATQTSVEIELVDPFKK